MVEQKHSIILTAEGLGTIELSVWDEWVSATDGQNPTFLGFFFLEGLRDFRIFEKKDRLWLAGSVFSSLAVYVASD